QDHVLLAVDDLDEAALVHEAHVAGLEEAVPGERLGRLVRPLPVAGHYLRPADADFADLADRHVLAVVVADRDFRRGDRQADRAGELARTEDVGRDRKSTRL